MTKLKECPFCGGNFTTQDAIDGRGVVPVCDNDDCLLNGCYWSFNTREEAIKAWNTRHNGWNFDMEAAPKGKNIACAGDELLLWSPDWTSPVSGHWDFIDNCWTHGDDEVKPTAWKHIESPAENEMNVAPKEK
jgi:hypothetical protein